MAGIKEPILHVKSLLKSIDVVNFDRKQTKLYSRIWNNQVDDEQGGEIPSYPRPAAFVEVLTPVQYETIGQGMATADLGVRIHLVHDFTDSNDGDFDQDLEVFDIRDSIISALTLQKLPNCGVLTLASESPDYNHAKIYHYILDFITNFTETGGNPIVNGSVVEMDGSKIELNETATFRMPTQQ